MRECTMTDTTAGEGVQAVARMLYKADEDHGLIRMNLNFEQLPWHARLRYEQAARTVIAAGGLAAQPSAGAQGEVVAMYVAMPVNADGNGPADEPETVRIEHQVWDAATNETLCVSPNEATARRIASLINSNPAQPDTGDVAALREALEPFARENKNWADSVPDDHRSLCTEPGSTSALEGSETEFTVGDLRRADRLLAALSKPNAQGREG